MRNQPTPENSIRPIVVKPKVVPSFGICGLTKVYSLIANGELESYRDGRSRLITVASIEAYVERKLAEARGEKAK
jgi:excisionase family DNA binding protein